MSLSTDDESSHSSSNECLLRPGKLNLDSLFFQVPTSKPSSSRIKDDSSDSDDDFTFENNDKVDTAVLLATVMKNLENAKKTEDLEKTPPADSEAKSERKDMKNALSDEIANLLLQGESGVSSASFKADKESTEELQDIKPQTEYNIPKEGVNITLPSTGSPMFSRRKKRNQDLEDSLRKKMNQRLQLNQVFIHKVGLLCGLALGFHLNRVINDCEVLSTSLSLVPSSSYPKGRVDLKYLEEFTKWFKNLFKLELKDIVEGVEKDMLLVRMKEKNVHNYKELVLLYIATLRSIGLNCRLVVSLYSPALKLQRDQLFKNSKEEPKSKKTSVSIPKKEPVTQGKKSAAMVSKPAVSLKVPGIKIIPENSIELEKKAKLNARKRAANVLLKFVSQPDSNSMKTKQMRKEEKELRSSPEKNKADAKNPPQTRQLRLRKAAQNLHSLAVGKTTKEVIFVKEKATKEKLLENRSQVFGETKGGGASTSAKFDNHLDQEESKTVSFAKEKISSVVMKTIAGTTSKSEEELEVKSLITRKINSKRIRANEKSENELEQELVAKLNKKTKTDTSKKQSKVKLPARKTMNDSKHINKDALSGSDSDKDFEPKVPVKKKKIKTQRKESRAKAQRTDFIDRRVLSSDEESAEFVDTKGAQNIWAEVFVESEESWISVSVLDDKIHCVSDIYRKAPKPVRYIIAWNSVGTVKDVTKRYCPHWLTVTRKQRIDENWWAETLNPWKEKRTAISRAEDEMLLQRELEQPLPKTISECKGHPLYALARHLLKFEAIYPPESVPLGHLKTGDAIYSRHCVHILCSRESWIKKARVVKPAQEPYKIVKAMPKYDKLSGTVMKGLPLELFGKWQTTQFIPPVAKNGIVPRNEYGNVDLFKECMLPIGTVHLKLPALNRVARKLNIDCVPAIVGFNFGSRGAVPATQGYIVCAEFEEILREAWHADQIEATKRAREKRLKRIYGNWRKLIKCIFIRERLTSRYDFNKEDDDNNMEDERKPSTSESRDLTTKLRKRRK